MGMSVHLGYIRASHGAEDAGLSITFLSVWCLYGAQH